MLVSEVSSAEMVVFWWPINGNNGKGLLLRLLLFFKRLTEQE
jgi:hypothetical protein